MITTHQILNITRLRNKLHMKLRSKKTIDKNAIKQILLLCIFCFLATFLSLNSVSVLKAFEHSDSDAEDAASLAIDFQEILRSHIETNQSRTFSTDAQLLEQDEKMLSSIMNIHLIGNNITDIGLKRICDFGQPRELTIINDHISDRMLLQLGNLLSIEKLVIRSNSITTGNLVSLKKLVRLNTLDLVGRFDDNVVDLLTTFKHLESLQIYGPHLTDGFLRNIGQLENLKHLDISDNMFNGRFLDRLVDIKSLKALDLLNTKIDDAGLEKLSQLVGLEILILANTNITDTGLTNLRGLKKLKQLTLTGTKVSDVGLESLREMTNLILLEVGGTNVSGTVFDTLARLQSIRRLYLSGSLVGDNGLRSIGKLKNLNVLDLDGTNITDDCANAFAGLAELEQLSISSTRLTVKGISKIIEVSPRLQILGIENCIVSEQDIKDIVKLNRKLRIIK